jgi:prevent-host-death family protein
MTFVDLSNVKNGLAAVLDQVERGRHVTIPRHGKPVVRLVPVVDRTLQARDAVMNIRALRQRIAQRGKIFTWNELNEYAAKAGCDALAAGVALQFTP